MNNYLINTISSEVLQNEIILSQGFSFESILRGIIGMIFLISSIDFHKLTAELGVTSKL
mgnify:CR=1 FL=1